ncbi:M67 family metallopeptidase [Nitrosomonas sp. Is37]|uniref:M67 family metallopeptidase n=1 Tax=Nitrosomonas sp. Is37 TaxID=3080535 RepID=UPI00294B6895|nr:M67 family metallopeptidase [Nitrosomonas sp. Is37]MDV6343408.1 M67 family metallopeptidase [Nitrosomonas sp. Is37]
MLTIQIEVVDAMLAQAHQDHPIETCGIIAGLEGSDMPSRLIPMRNAAESETFFKFDPQQQLKIWKEMEARGEEPIVIYHSHTSSQAFPSRTDIEYALEPQSHYVIISTDPGYKQEIRSFRILNGMVVEERIRVLDKFKSVADISKVA